MRRFFDFIILLRFKIMFIYPCFFLPLMVRTLKVEYDLKRCVGNAKCVAAAPVYFYMAGKKAVLNGGMPRDNVFFLAKDFSDEDAAKIIKAGQLCPVNAIGVLEKGKEIVSRTVKLADKMEETTAHYDDAKEFVMDPNGYFLIRVDHKAKTIEVGFCKEPNKVAVKVTGKTPLEIYQTILKKNIISRMDHAAYLGRELQKAYIALEYDLVYVQDDELDFGKKIN